MGMQISCGVYHEMPEEDPVWANSAGVGASLSGTGTTEGMRNHRGAPHGRSRAHADLDSAEILGGAGDGVYQGQERDPHRTGICWPTAEFCGPAVLGAWVLGLDGGTGRSRGAPLHPGTGKGRSADRSTDADAALSG